MAEKRIKKLAEKNRLKRQTKQQEILPGEGKLMMEEGEELAKWLKNQWVR